MKINLPADCGNSPRMALVGEFATAWAAGEELTEYLADDAAWTLVGKGQYTGPEIPTQTAPPFTPKRMEVTSVVTHGRLASCDGYLEAEEQRIGFSHVLRFASTAKSAKIVELRSYLIQASVNR